MRLATWRALASCLRNRLPSSLSPAPPLRASQYVCKRCLSTRPRLQLSPSKAAAATPSEQTPSTPSSSSGRPVPLPTDYPSVRGMLSAYFAAPDRPTARQKRVMRHTHDMNIHPPPRSTLREHPTPVKDHESAQIALLDPRGVRTRLFARDNPDAPQPGDILLVNFRQGGSSSSPAADDMPTDTNTTSSSSSTSKGSTLAAIARSKALDSGALITTSTEPFAGVCMSIRRKGLDTAILLRNKLMLVGVEMWVKIYSPNVRSIEVVKRAARRARRARLTYLRKPKHDLGGAGVEAELESYMRTRRLIRSGEGSGVGSGGGGSKKGGKKRR